MHRTIIPICVAQDLDIILKDRSYDVRLDNQSYLRNKYGEKTLINIMCFIFYGVKYITQLTFMIRNIIQIVRQV
jgi:hypothetical protein